MRRLKIMHETRYDFAAEVQLAPHQVMIRPREGHDIRSESSELDITPAHQRRWHRDIYDNSVLTIDFDAPASSLSIVSTVVIQHYNEQPLDFVVDDDVVDYPVHYAVSALPVLVPYLDACETNEAAVRDWLAHFWQPGDSIQTYALLESICKGIKEQMKYQVREEPGVQAPSQTLALGSGSCRDFAWLFIAATRMLGLAARFVSGYLYVPSADGQDLSTHAWAEVYLPGAGWKGFDPTIGALAGPDHIAVASARRPESVPPVAGSFIGPADTKPAMTVKVQVSLLEPANN
jgi:transglutaminase-like putative cysteine protease